MFRHQLQTRIENGAAADRVWARAESRPPAP